MCIRDRFIAVKGVKARGKRLSTDARAKVTLDDTPDPNAGEEPEQPFDESAGETVHEGGESSPSAAHPEAVQAVKKDHPEGPSDPQGEGQASLF